MDALGAAGVAVVAGVICGAAAAPDAAVTLAAGNDDDGDEKGIEPAAAFPAAEAGETAP